MYSKSFLFLFSGQPREENRVTGVFNFVLFLFLINFKPQTQEASLQLFHYCFANTMARISFFKKTNTQVKKRVAPI